MTTLDRSNLEADLAYTLACSPTPCAIAHRTLDALDAPGQLAAENVTMASTAPAGPIAGLAEASAPDRDMTGTGVAPSRAARSSGPAHRPVDEEGEVGWVGPCSPERPVMEILFRCIEAGRRYYAVRLNGQEIFVGTRSECDRFLAIHNEKVALEQAEARRTPRGRPAALHIYRTARA